VAYSRTTAAIRPRTRGGGATEAQRLLHTVWARDTVVILL
jgi:hypothetical protein